MDWPVTNECILDRVEQIALDEDAQRRFQFDLATIRYLAHGLHFLARAVGNLEKEFREQHGTDAEEMSLSYGPDWGPHGIQYSVIACSFHWYSVSACNMAKLIGAIAYQVDSTRPTPDRYVQDVMPRIRTFRDKIGAHAAATMQSSHDNPAERSLSVLPPIVFSRGYFVATPFVLIRAEAEAPHASSDTSTVKPWSLTVAHHELGRRYWSGLGDSRGGPHGPI